MATTSGPPSHVERTTSRPHRLVAVRNWVGRALLLIGALVVIWFFARAGTQPKMDELPADVRAALYARTRADLELCVTRAGASIESHCAAQAAFIRSFPECDDACRRLASELGPRATR